MKLNHLNCKNWKHKLCRSLRVVFNILERDSISMCFIMLLKNVFGEFDVDKLACWMIKVDSCLFGI